MTSTETERELTPDDAYIEIRFGPVLVWRVWLDGRVEGFPAGSIIINRIVPYLAQQEAKNGRRSP